MVHYKLVKITINALSFAKVIINIVIHHYSVPNLIISDRGLIFISKFWSSLCYFFDIKQRFYTTFDS